MSEVTSEAGEQRGRLRKSGFSPFEPSSHGGQPLPTTPCHPGRRRRSCNTCGGSLWGLPTQILSQMAATLAQRRNGARQDTHSPMAPDLSHLPAPGFHQPHPQKPHVLCLWVLIHHSLPSVHTSSREPSCVAPGFRALLSLKVPPPPSPDQTPDGPSVCCHAATNTPSPRPRQKQEVLNHLCTNVDSPGTAC